MKNSLKNKWKEEYENGIETPSSDLWDKLEAKLEISNSEASTDEVFQNLKVENSIKNNNWWKYAAIVLFLLACSFVLKLMKDDRSAGNETQQITQVETSNKPETRSENALAPNENTLTHSETNNSKEARNLPNTIVTDKKSADLYQKKSEKISSNSQNFIRDKKTLITDPENLKDIQIVQRSIIEDPKQEVLVNNTTTISAQKTVPKYVKADELLFGREIQKNNENVAKNEKVGGFENSKFVKLIMPSSIKILGITVYSEEISN